MFLFHRTNVAESIRRKELVFPKSVFMYLDFLVSFMLYILAPLIFMFYSSHEKSLVRFREHDLFYVVLVVITLFAWYFAYRKIVELNLKSIPSSFTPQETKEYLLTYAEHCGYTVFLETDELLIFGEEFKYQSSHARSIVCILNGQEVLFTMFRYNFRFNRPTFTSHIYTYNNLKKLLR